MNSSVASPNTVTIDGGGTGHPHYEFYSNGGYVTPTYGGTSAGNVTISNYPHWGTDVRESLISRDKIDAIKLQILDALDDKSVGGVECALLLAILDLLSDL